MVQKTTVKKQCLKCLNEKVASTQFYKSNSDNHADGRFPICKECVKGRLKLENPLSDEAVQSVKDILLEMNRPFLYSQYLSSVEEYGSGNEMFGKYIKNIQLNFKNYTWKDSDFNKIMQDENDDEKQEKEEIIPITSEFIISNDTLEKWGFGYTNEEYKAFEQKYTMLKNNYQEKTAMHTEALLTYIRYRVKEELATARDDIKSAKEWGQLAQKSAQDAKINPSQLSKSDLSDGLDTFGQLVRSVEQSVDIIPILPKFKKRPQDSVDFTLLCYINYVRDLKGLPPVEYEEIYEFYEERKKEYADRLDFLKEDEE